MKKLPSNIQDKLGRNLHNLSNHPLNIIKKHIQKYFGESFHVFDELSPQVHIENNFDDLLIPINHPSRSESDTFYLDENHVLRTHTSAHQTQLLKSGFTKFLVTGDVYRRDAIDATHFPVFHQMEGVKLLGNVSEEEVVEDLKKTLSGLIKYLFGDNVAYRFADEYFPFTNPSFEIEVKYNGREMEVLGSGVIQPAIIRNCGLPNQKGWAFGMGLERLAMIFFDINDIRYFWNTDPRFLNQFKDGEFNKFQPFSKYPPINRDVSMWISEDFQDNYFFDMVRDNAGDLIEDVRLSESFTHPKTNRTSKLFSLTFRSLDRTLNSEEVDEIMNNIYEGVKSLNCEPR